MHSTPKEPQVAVVRALRILRRSISKVGAIFHATTIATNMLMGQIGLRPPRCALITTKGFRDILEIGRQRRPELYNLFFERPRVLIPRRLRLEVDERTDYAGRILRRPKNEELALISKRLREMGVESVAISLINSYANPSNEIMIKNWLREELPGLYISVSSEVDNEYREYERTSTTVVNAFLMPVVAGYLGRLREAINEIFPGSKMLIMKSDGGVSDESYVSMMPISIIESGPAAGVIASGFIGGLVGDSNIISFDMGGTTAKSGAILNGRPIITTEYEVAGKIHCGRIVKGSGYPVRYPFIDLAEVSSGGGSIVWVDEAGGLRVGPISAGADPGPACYGLGGEEPTITDAHLILGRIGEETLLGGEMRISVDLARDAFREKVASISGYDIIEAARGAILLANTIMGKILRIVTIERGHDPRDFTMVAFGGAGPMHACPLAEELEIRKIIIPILPGIFSALGLVAAGFKHLYVRPIMRLLSELELDVLIETASMLEKAAEEDLGNLRIPLRDVRFSLYMEARYWGQGYELLVPLGDPRIIRNIDELAELFHRTHRMVYGYDMREEEIELVNIRLEVVGSVGRIRLASLRRGGREDPSSAIKEHRECYFETIDDFAKTPVYFRERLLAGDIIRGPAIIEQYDATTIVYPGWHAIVDAYGNIVLRREGDG